jgi:prepilin-type processing-associated H-X9-DG protein
VVSVFDYLVESHRWFRAGNIKSGQVFDAVSAEVDVDRHGGTSANYLYADGHVALVSAEAIAKWCRAPLNFVRPRDAAEATQFPD